MASWMEERDRLVAQTAAFVQQVAAAHPHVSARPEVEKLLADNSAAIEPCPSEPVPSEPAASEPAPSEPAPLPPQVVAPVVPTVDAVLATRPVVRVSARPAARLPVSERSDIMERVAAFRARQARVNDEREAYYETVRAKIRNQLGNDPGDGRL
jgi:hypothetical protein